MSSSDASRHDVKLLWKLQACTSGGWRGPMVHADLPQTVRRFLEEAKPAALERLLIETTHRLQDEHGQRSLGDRAALHRLLQEELRGYRPASSAERMGGGKARDQSKS